MPAKSRPAKTSRRKIWIHTFYLCQPFLQFFALVAVMLILARCSPLAPSTNKTSELKIGPAIEEKPSPEADAAALEESIAANRKDLGTSELAVISLAELEKLSKNAAHIDRPVDENDVQAIFDGKKNRGNLPPARRKKQRLLVIPLELESQEAFFASNQLRINLSERISAHSKEKARRILLRHLQSLASGQELAASSFLVLPNAVISGNQNVFDGLQVKIQATLSVVDEDRAFFELSRVDGNEDEDNAALLDAALQESLQLAILLE